MDIVNESDTLGPTQPDPGESHRSDPAQGRKSGGQSSGPPPDERDDAENDPSTRLKAALDRLGRQDSAGTIKLLEEAGFSLAEAGRLVFERVRPRDEGLARV